MTIYTTLTLADLEEIAARMGIQLYNASDEGVRSSGKFAGRRAIHALLRPDTNEAYRLVKPDAYTRSGVRRCWAVSWQGHFDFMAQLFDADPGATLRSALATYRGREDFHALAPATGWKNIGSMMEPVAYRDAVAS